MLKDSISDAYNFPQQLCAFLSNHKYNSGTQRYIWETSVIANVQNICNLIDREEYKNGRIVLSTSILLNSLTKKTNNIRMTWQEILEIYQIK